jgi:LAGLIDADG DNA endonuclease family protein
MEQVVVNKLSDSEAAYLAGIIDGEGTITLTRTHRGENRRPVVSISSTELPLLEYVRSVVGAGKITSKRRARNYHSPSFAYTLFSRQALTLLGPVSRYLRTYKSERARLLLDEYILVTPRNGRYTVRERRARQDFENRFFALSVRATANQAQPIDNAVAVFSPDDALLSLD